MPLPTTPTTVTEWGVLITYGDGYQEVLPVPSRWVAQSSAADKSEQGVDARVVSRHVMTGVWKPLTS